MTTPFVCILALGGTIASRPGGGRLAQPELTADDLAALVGDATGLPAIRAESVLQAPSGDLTFADIAAVAERVRAVLAAGAIGVVITQGTDTLEETAFALDLFLEVAAPVVVTGALRNPSLPGADGPANLLAAIRVAASPAAAGLGVVVVMNDEVHAARFVRKTHTHKPSAFAAPAAGPLGWIAEDRVRIALRPAEPTPTIAWRGAAPDVPLVTLGFSFAVAALDPLLDEPPAGLVIAGFGVGHVPARTVETIGALAAEIPVILASRIGAGEVFHATYGYPGSESDLIARGCIGAGYLDALKARVLLALLLGDGADRRRVAEAFERF
ncbi:MAG TPA: asparaginase [Caulobacteraceae bacterium]|nr:asparaginase [Caulobacteraceae bacterium]